MSGNDQCDWRGMACPAGEGCQLPKGHSGGHKFRDGSGGRKYPTFAEQQAIPIPEEIREFRERLDALEKPIKDAMAKRFKIPQIASIKTQFATLDEIDMHGDTVGGTRTRPQIELTLYGDNVEAIRNCAGLRIGGMLFVPLPDGDEILDSEWKTGRVYGT